MSYYRVCPHCGAHLDVGEVCDCRGALLDEAHSLLLQLTPEQTEAVFAAAQKETAQGVGSTQGDGVEHVDHAVSASIMNEMEEKVK